MHCLSDLRDLFLSHNIKIKEFGGWFLKVGKDTYTMLDGDYYKNGNIISKKDIQTNLKKKKNK
jgi:hypothetical protein